jgi:hypothetical protein
MKGCVSLFMGVADRSGGGRLCEGDRGRLWSSYGIGLRGGVEVTGERGYGRLWGRFYGDGKGSVYG